MGGKFGAVEVIVFVLGSGTWYNGLGPMAGCGRQAMTNVVTEKILDEPLYLPSGAPGAGWESVDVRAVTTARQYHAWREARRKLARERLRQERYQRVRATIRRLAPAYPALRAVYLFGSLVQPGRHLPRSDIDVAIECDDPEVESRFWRALEAELEADVDLWPCQGAIAWAVSTYGECVYAREVSPAGTQHSA
jgi:predicted nucleotidyltransferase